MTKLQSTKAMRRRAHRRSEREAARANLDFILERDGGQCVWCKQDVIRMKAIPKSRRLSCTSGLLRYIAEDGGIRTARIATVDHLQRRADGGNSTPGNLVLSCLPCNWARDAEAKAKMRKRKEAA